jgi:GrpB-like predicted nucleotidyltransferase (UPF0157 family)
MRAPLVVDDYDARWPQQFETLRTRVSAALGPLAAAIEHIGSTAVPGLAAKPIIDIDVLLRSKVDLPFATERLGTLGYEHQGDLGVAGREVFRAPAGDVSHHLYVCPPGSRAYLEHLAFRDHLRTHPEDARAYECLKRSLAERFGGGREGYTQAKTEFIETILLQAKGAGAEHFRSGARIIS